MIVMMMMIIIIMIIIIDFTIMIMILMIIMKMPRIVRMNMKIRLDEHHDRNHPNNWSLSMIVMRENHK